MAVKGVPRLSEVGADGLAGVQSIVNYQGVEGERRGEGQALRLIGCETLEGGTVWLRDAVEAEPGAAAS